MLNCQDYLLRVFALVLVAQVVAAGLTNELKERINSDLIRHPVYRYLFSEIEETLLCSELFTRYDIGGYFRSTAQSVNVLVSRADQTYIAKLIKEKDKNFATCKLLEELQKNEKTKITYASEILDIDRFSESQSKFFYCVLIFKMNEDTLEKAEFIIKQEDKETKTKNSETLYFFFGKMIKFFAELNFKAYVLHGDIRPSNILVKQKKIENSPGIDFEPEIMDFDLMLENQMEKELFDPIVRYKSDYRCSEMDDNIKTNNTTGIEYYEKSILAYRYSKHFVEDVFALGKTFFNVLEKQKKFLDDKFYGIGVLNFLVEQMTSVKEKDREGSFFERNFLSSIKVRPNMEQVFGSYLKDLKAYTEYQNKALSEELISSFENSKIFVPNNNIII